MARPNGPVTLNDLRRSENMGAAGRGIVGSGGSGAGVSKGSGSSFGGAASSSMKKYAASDNRASANGAGTAEPKIYHIPSLPSASEARAMLDRVVREFVPIIRRRGYNVRSISEMCCCADGLDTAPGSRRKLKRMDNNVLGYNCTTSSYGGKSHTIHLRLRHAADHSRMHLYEDVAGTLAHELSHCEHGPHNDAFYKLMDEILEEHSSLMASGMTMGSESMPAFGGTGQTLGSGGSASATAATTTSAQDMDKMRAARLQSLDNGKKVGGDANFQQWMTPRDAAVAAAMARHRQQQMRLRGNRCCRPCTIVIDDSDDETNQNDGDYSGADKKKKRGSADDAKQPKVIVIETDPTKAKENANPQKSLALPAGRGTKRAKHQHSEEADSKPPARSRVKNTVIDLTSDDDHLPTKNTSAEKWNCGRCTFLNQQSQTVCLMCSHPK